ncbi:LTA synthase family protein [Leucobacter sp. GX24907]
MTSSQLRRALWAVAIVGLWVLVLAGLMFAGAGIWVRSAFGRVSVDQALANLDGVGGEGAGGGGLVGGAVVMIVVVPLVITLLLALLVEKSRRELHAADLLRGWKRWALRGGAMLLAVLVPLGGGAILSDATGVEEYIASLTTDADLSDVYVAPRVVESDAEGQRPAGGERDRSDPGGPDIDRPNLVLIYLESIENDFADEELFGSNMLRPVQQATTDWEQIPALREYEGGGWTMAGIVATQCGIPLRSAQSLSDRSQLNLGIGDARYMPGATCLGEVLHDQGYRNVYLGGADTSFASKRDFLEEHGYDEVNGLQEWREQGETEVRSDWGLSDRKLMAQARKKITQLHESGEPFNLTMLTLDTHESAYRHRYCPTGAANGAVDDEGSGGPAESEDMVDITYCSMEQVAGFLGFMDEKGYLDDTVVVVMGDHLKTLADWNAFQDELEDREGRTIFNRIHVPEGLQQNGTEFARDDFDQFALYPTLIELLGFELEGHRAGISVSALATEEEIGSGTVLDLSDREYLDLVRSRSSDFFRDIWGRRATGMS